MSRGYRAVKADAYSLNSDTRDPLGHSRVDKGAVSRKRHAGEELGTALGNIEEIRADHRLPAREYHDWVSSLSNILRHTQQLSRCQLARGEAILRFGAAMLALEVAARGQFPEYESNCIVHSSYSLTIQSLRR